MAGWSVSKSVFESITPFAFAAGNPAICPARVPPLPPQPPYHAPLSLSKIPMALLVHASFLSGTFSGLVARSVALGKMFPKVLTLGMEIRIKVADYVRDRIIASRR